MEIYPKKLSTLKIPLWIIFFPIIGNLIFSIIYKSWMFDFDNINIFWKKYRKMVIRTSGVWVISLIVYLLFTVIYWLVVLCNNYTNSFFVPIFVAISLCLLVFNLIYQPINLWCEPKKIIKEYNLGDSKINKIDLKNYCGNYNFEKCINNFKNNLFKLSYFCLFSNSKEIKNKWILNIQNATTYNLAKMNTIYREFNVNQNNIWNYSHFKYLFSTGIWYLGTIFIIYKLFNKDSKFINRTRKIGSIFTSLFWLINILILAIFLIAYFLINQNSMIFYFSPFIFVAINIIYINFIGLIISCNSRKKLLSINT